MKKSDYERRYTESCSATYFDVSFLSFPLFSQNASKLSLEIFVSLSGISLTTLSNPYLTSTSLKEKFTVKIQFSILDNNSQLKFHSFCALIIFTISHLLDSSVLNSIASEMRPADLNDAAKTRKLYFV